MGSVSQSAELGLTLRMPNSRRTVWVDPAGIRGVLRHHLTRGAASTILAAALIGIVAGVGETVPLAALAVFAGLQVLVLSGRRGHARANVEGGLRAGLVGWPIGLAVLVAAGRHGPTDLFELVATVGFAVAMFVALTERRVVAVAWAVVTAFLVAVTAVATGFPLFETGVLAGAIGGGAIAGDQMREILEGFLGARGRLMRDVSRVPVSDDPFVTAELLLRPLVRWAPFTSVALTWFRQDGRAVILGAAGDGLPASIAAHRELPEVRNKELRAQAQQGPWISGWTVRSDDGGYSKDVAAAGIKATVCVPLVFEGRVVGLVGVGLTDRGDDRSAMAEYIPTLVQFADAAALELGPSLVRHEEDSEARHALDEILLRGAYRTEFQAIRRLSDNRTIGYEALTRFETTWTPSQVFHYARAVGRLRDVEVATMRSSIVASANLPTGCWVSLNCSPDLLVDTDVLAPILAGARHEIVLELSEQDVISDYGPVAAALARLGASRRLAVDDAGAGFASLRHILEVRPQFVKLDLGLVQGVADDLTRTALVAGFVRFAADAGFDLIAEGIESEADRRALRRLGVRFGQGFLLGRPLPAGQASSPSVPTRRSTSPSTLDLHAGTIPTQQAP